VLKLFPAIGILSSLAAQAAFAQHQDFTVHFSNCSEFAGWGPVSLTQAQPLVPTGYTIASARSGQAGIVVRVTNCETAQVGGTPPVATTLSQVGINLVSPDGTGTINNYTLVYISNNPFLVEAFLRAGVPARFDPGITYQYTLNSARNGGELYAAAPSSGLPAYFFYGTEQEPAPKTQQLFIANWWFGPRAVIKQSTTFPQISFGSANMTFYTSRTSELGKLIGGNADSDFSFLSVRGEYASADMTVTSSGR
jgi:hypothetical protein